MLGKRGERREGKKKEIPELDKVKAEEKRASVFRKGGHCVGGVKRRIWKLKRLPWRKKE